MPYAFSEIWPLCDKLADDKSWKSPHVRYLCALCSELTYYHVPQFEIDNAKRAKRVPCNAYQRIVVSGKSTNIERITTYVDVPIAFIVVERSCIAIGLRVREYLFIAFRGTSLMYDWFKNLMAWKTRFISGVPHVFIDLASFPWPVLSIDTQGTCHRGFLEEASRVALRLIDEMSALQSKPKHIFVTGHSMGGAIAALCEHILARHLPNFFKFDQNHRADASNVTKVIFGSPRYGDLALYMRLNFNYPAHVRYQENQKEDIVPYFPPKLLGYCDHILEIGIDGERTFASFHLMEKWRRYLLIFDFVRRKFSFHSIETYRKAIGRNVKAKYWMEPLIDAEKITLKNI